MMMMMMKKIILIAGELYHGVIFFRRFDKGNWSNFVCVDEE
jgi:hypothetical protein